MEILYQQKLPFISNYYAILCVKMTKEYYEGKTKTKKTF